MCGLQSLQLTCLDRKVFSNATAYFESVLADCAARGRVGADPGNGRGGAHSYFSFPLRLSSTFSNATRLSNPGARPKTAKAAAKAKADSVPKAKVEAKPKAAPKVKAMPKGVAAKPKPIFPPIPPPPPRFSHLARGRASFNLGEAEDDEDEDEDEEAYAFFCF